MNKIDIVDDVKSKVTVTKKCVANIVDLTIESIIGAINSGDKVGIRGLGTFETVPRLDGLTIRFTPSTTLKRSVQNLKEKGY